MAVFLFGDQTAPQELLLRKLAARKDNGILTTYLERAAGIIRGEIQKLPRYRREIFPDFSTIVSLVDNYHTLQVKIPELESSLLTISQLAHFIGYFEDTSSEFPDPTRTRVVGLCTGLLAAAAVTSARSLSELLPLALETTRLSFRVGNLVSTTGRILAGDESSSSWSTIVTEISQSEAQAALDDYYKGFSGHYSSRAYISATSTAAITISGAPASTKRLFEKAPLFRGSTRCSIPVFAPYHARHLYSEESLDLLFDASSKRALQQFTPRALLYSSSSGQACKPSDAFGLMHKVARDILLEPIHWDMLLRETVNQTLVDDQKTYAVMALGVSNIADSFVAALKAGGTESVTVIDYTMWDCNSYSDRGRPQNDKIAIVGMAGRFPNSANHEELWDLLSKGLDVHKEIPKDRFDAQAHYDLSGKGRNKSHTPFGCFIDQPGLFDPRFFNMSPREAAQTDPMGRLALVTAYEALEMSGYVPNRTPSTKLHRVGTFYGQTSDDWREINASENVDTYFITGGVRAFAPGRINYYFKFSGPSFSIDTACSSSLAAIQLACTSLWSGDCDTACAGGLNVLTNPDIFSGLSKGQFLSKTGGCKTYDNDADGYCRGDGCGTVVLKRYEDALADKDNILGCILSAGTNHSAEAVSITHPHAGAQEYLYRKVLAEAGVDPHEITYVEMHGTGTQAGDGIEMTSVTNAFAPQNRRRRTDEPLYLGAIKANIGHGEAASGINSMVKVMLMMRENMIPANVGIKGVMNKTFPKDMAERNIHIPLANKSMPRNGAKKRKFFLNNFSAAGGNTAVLLEDGPLRIAPANADPRTHHVVTVTARAISSLKRNINNLISFLDQHPSTTLSSLSYTTTARRIQHNYRVSFVAKDMLTVKVDLASQLKDTYSPVAMAPTGVAFAFTGQGSHYTSLGKQLYEQLPTFKATIEQLDAIARLQGHASFMPLLQGMDVDTLPPTVVQLGMSCIQVALARMWLSWGLKPLLVIGHSLGEYAALHIAGVISVSDMIRLVGKRAELLLTHCKEFSHGMLAVKADEDTIMKCLGRKMTEVACRNTPTETVLCGTSEQMAVAYETLEAHGIKATALKVPFAFHSAQIDAIMKPFGEISASVEYSKPRIPVISPLLCGLVQEPGVIGPDYLPRHARETVDFCNAITAAFDSNLCTNKVAWLEIGAHPVCSHMIKNTIPSVTVAVPSLRRNEDSWKTIATSICALFSAGVYINFDEYHRDFNKAQELLTLPTYSFDDKTYWLDYHNNWCLTKGTLPLSCPNPAPNVVDIEKVSKLSTTTCQRIVFEELHANSGTVIVQSDLADSKLAIAVSGHRVNGAPLCPSSLYADQALTITDYLYKELRPSQPAVGFNVCRMEVTKPLIAMLPAPAEGQHIQIEAVADIEAGQAILKWRSVTPDGKLVQDHATCIVKFEAFTDWQDTWDSTSYMVEQQINTLQKKLATGEANKFLRGMAYKLFKALVDYDDRYRGMEEVIVDGKEMEAVATIAFQTTEKDGNFFCAPYWIDSLCHISGFICNGTDLIDSDKYVCISHGWGTMRFAKRFSADKKYTSYVRMRPQPGNILAGDVYIFEGKDVVGVVGGLKFQQIPRKSLNAMLPPKQAKSTAGSVAKAPIAKAPVAKPVPAASKESSAAPAYMQTPPPMTNIVTTPLPMIVKPAQPPKKSDSIASQIMAIIATETDVDMSELVDEAAFENLGVDSLMSLTISAKFREELELEIPSNLFVDQPTVGEMKKYFSVFDDALPSDPREFSDSDSGSIMVYTPDMSNTSTLLASTPLPTPPNEEFEKKSDVPSVARIIWAEGITPSDGGSKARNILATEMGVEPFDIDDKADLGEMGMDSLMSLTVLSSLREATGQDLPGEFLTTNGTLKDIEFALDMREKPAPQAILKRPSAGPRSTTNVLQGANLALCKGVINVSGCPPATSLILQGNARTSTKKLFLLPDGSGSSTSYMLIPKLGPEWAVFGLTCPFLKTPEKWTVGVDGIAQLYIKEIKRRQPVGPYILGGWSAGGVAAYETACQLLAAHDEIERMILIDCPSPMMASEPLPPNLHLFFDEIGLLGPAGKGSAPVWLLPHFSSAIKALSEYKPQDIPQGMRPKTYLVICREGVCGKPGDPRPAPTSFGEPAPMKWLLDDRTDFGPNGWEYLLDDIEIGIMDGNHFSMMDSAHAQTLGAHIRKGLGITTRVVEEIE